MSTRQRKNAPLLFAAVTILLCLPQQQVKAFTLGSAHCISGHLRCRHPSVYTHQNLVQRSKEHTPPSIPIAGSVVCRHVQADGNKRSTHGTVGRKEILRISLGLLVSFGLGKETMAQQSTAGLGINKFSSEDIKKLDAKKIGGKPEAAGAMAIFQDDVLGFGFAVPPSFKGQSQKVGEQGQIIVFFDSDKPDVDTRITLVSQPSPVASMDELQKTVIPAGEILKQTVETKREGKRDGNVLFVETKTGESQISSVFALRDKGQSGTWLVSLSAQTKAEEFSSERGQALQKVVKNFKLIYPEDSFKSRGEDEFGAAEKKLFNALKEVDLNDEVKAVPGLKK